MIAIIDEAGLVHMPASAGDEFGLVACGKHWSSMEAMNLPEPDYRRIAICFECFKVRFPNDSI